MPHVSLIEDSSSTDETPSEESKLIKRSSSQQSIKTVKGSGKMIKNTYSRRDSSSESSESGSSDSDEINSKSDSSKT